MAMNETLPRHDLMTTDTDLAALDRPGRQIDAVWACGAGMSHFSRRKFRIF